MYSEAKTDRRSDLRLGGSVSLVVHATLLILVGAAVTHTRARFTPPALQVIRLDVDIPATAAAENALASPSASPVETAVPQAAAPPRPALTRQTEERLMPSALPQDAAPAALETVLPAGMAGSVTSYGTTESITKSIFAAGDNGALNGMPADKPGSSARSSGIGIEGPVSLRNGMKPLYPVGARQRGEEGTVVLETTVGPDGHPTQVTLISSSRFADLDRAAIKALERAVFNPAQDGGRPVEARARITIIFRLTN